MKNVKMIVCDGGVSFDFVDIRVQKICKYLIQRGYEVEVIVLYRNEKRKDNYFTTINGIKCCFISCRGKLTDLLVKKVLQNKESVMYPVWFITFIFKLKKYLKNKQVDFIQGENLFGGLAAMLTKKQSSIVFDMREFFGLQATSHFRSKIDKIINQYLCKKSDYVLYVNNMQKENIEDIYYNKLYYVPNYPDVNLVKALKKTESKTLRICYIGAIRSLQKEYFEKFSKICSKFDNISFYIYGDGGGYNSVYYLGDKYKDKVYVMGHYDGLNMTSKIFANCDILYCAYDVNVVNWKMAEPIKFFEAIETQTPIIVSETSAIESIVNQYDIGFSIDASDENDITELLQVISDNKDILFQKKKNLQKLKGKYSWDICITNLNSVY